MDPTDKTTIGNLETPGPVAIAAVSEVVVSAKAVKSGKHTSEFKVTIAVMIASFATMLAEQFGGTDTMGKWITVAAGTVTLGLASMGYSIARGKAKSGG